MPLSEKSNFLFSFWVIKKLCIFFIILFLSVFACFLLKFIFSSLQIWATMWLCMINTIILIVFICIHKVHSVHEYIISVSPSFLVCYTCLFLYSLHNLVKIYHILWSLQNRFPYTSECFNLFFFNKLYII